MDKKIVMYSSFGVLAAFSVFNIAILKEIPMWQIIATLGIVGVMFTMLWNNRENQ